MRIAPLAEVQAKLSKFVEQCQEGPVVITKYGRPAAMLVAYSPRLLRMLDQAAANARAGRTFGHDEFWAEVDRLDAEKNAE